ncbi:MFS transporter [Pseudoroseicyclus tamaricis]|uniref:MFS transporter n=1 Tax=Pseudoroseicyclus tamaricis TaxID=2705421 RepID=A0A6B2JQN9_9RHOB|nr:MFS transporter [Pseudoroseicyclus tamaricis]NDV00458.1 MFS transporter [Pseudoroseicyclus tamaricis]
MLTVLRSSWPLFIGLFMMMIGNGLQGTLLGLRGAMEEFSTSTMSYVMACYFAGFLFASRIAPRLIRNVGHVRVFAALGSAISAILILYPTLVEPWAWMLGRAVIGFCFCGVYITCESWLNDSATNETRGTSLSLYMIVQLAGIVVAQYIVLLGDIGGYVLFIIPSMLVSLAFAPILLSVGTVPAFAQTKPLPLARLISASPLAAVGMFLLGGVFAAQFGMAAVYGAQAGMTVPQISTMISAIYIAALALQYPIGWLSDRMDRRKLIIYIALAGGIVGLLGMILPGSFIFAVIAAAAIGGASNPLYALLIAYGNDYLDREDMAAASGGFLFVNGVGAVFGPILVGWVMEQFGPGGYWAYMSLLLLALAAYGLYRMTQRERSAETVADQVPYAPVLANASPLVAEMAQEAYIEAEEEAQAEAAEAQSGAEKGEDGSPLPKDPAFDDAKATDKPGGDA